jgi:DNA-binding CsgD family transcriptional regulator
MRHSNELIDRLIKHKLEKFGEIDSWVAGIKIIQSIDPEKNLFICKRGRQRYQLSQGFFNHLPKDVFRKLIFNEKCPHTCLIGSMGHDSRLYIRYDPARSPSDAELISVEVIRDDSAGLPLLRVIHILPSNLAGWLPFKTARIVNEMAFFSDNKEKFQQLTKRSREVLALMVKGLSAEEIGERLFISVNTVNTHKRHVREVLEIKSHYELLQYGLAFDLV